ncbi:MAG: hypothetical protein PHE83_01945 [Opitutaceae bacterium]|nr:hypothetical protein [Opitutaceae bacterium]
MREFIQSFYLKERILFVLGVALVLAWYAYASGRANLGWISTEPHAYYELLTDAILSGQTHLKLEPDPRLKTLPNPWAGPQGIPRAHDASYFNGHYYLYFGIAPVILLYAPWRLLTGTFLAEGLGTGVFCAAGFLLAAVFFLRCKRRFFPALSPWWTLLGVLLLGLGSFVQFELHSPQFYQVPIACGYACAMGAAHAVLSAMSSPRLRGQAAGLMIASALWGCAVGARPNYVFGLTMVGAAALGLTWSRLYGEKRPAGEVWRLWFAAVAPAALAGAGLAFYNYARFGDVFEFGLTYQFAAIEMRDFRLVGWDNVLPALKAYLFAGKEYNLYYPFAYQTADTFGVIPWAPFALLALGFPLTWRLARLRERAWMIGAGFVLAVALANFGSLLIYSYHLGRYELDFLPEFMLVALLVASALFASAPAIRSWRHGLLRILAGGLLAFTLVHSLVHGLPMQFERREVLRAARLLDTPAAMFEKLADIRQGPVALEVEFPAAAPGRKEPLVASGNGRDLIYVQYESPGRARFGFSHFGAGGPLSEPVELVPGRRYRLVVDMGGLYPPPEHPAFAGWSEIENKALHRRMQVNLDGLPVLRAASVFYRSDPFGVLLGKNPLPPPWHEARFTGRILHHERLGLPPSTNVTMGFGSGPVRLTVRFPPFRNITAQPLVSTGRHGAGDLVYVLYLAPGKIRFGHDSWNGAAVETEPVYFDPEEDQVIEIDMGSLYPGATDLLKYSHRFQLRFNGRELISIPRPFNPSFAAEVEFGYNAIGASTADVLFNGPKLEGERLPSFPPAAGRGALYLTLQLPAERVGRREPLLVTGRNGAGDLVYIGYPDATHVQIGFDHWKVGGPLSEPIPVLPGLDLEVEISLGPLYPPDDPAWQTTDQAVLERLRSTLQVRVDGRVVLQQAVKAYPAGADQVYIGKNPIGGSTCGAEFTGRIVRVEHIGAAYLK